MRAELKTYFAEFTNKVASKVGSSFSLDDFIKALNDGKIKLSDHSIYKRDEKIDFPWLDKFEEITAKVLAISKNPRTHIRVYKDVVNSEAAVKIDNNDLIATMEEPKFWKLDDYDEYRPEYVYTDTYETDIAIYENRFICHLVDRMYHLLNSSINYLLEHVKNIDKNFMFDEISPSDIKSIERNAHFYSLFYSKKENKALDNNEFNPLLTLPGTSLVPTLQRLLNIKRSLTHVMSTTFYSTIKKAKKVLENEIRPTNLLMGDKLYSPCFKFYFELKKIQHKVDDRYVIDELSYRDYIVLDLCLCLKGLGYEFPSNKIFQIKKGGHIEIENLSIRNKENMICSFRTIKNGIDITFRLDYKQEDFPTCYNFNSRAINRITLILKPNLPKDFFTDIDLAKSYRQLVTFKLDHGFSNAFIVTPLIDVQSDDVVVCSPYDKKIGAHIKNMLRNCLMFVKGDSYLYQKVCPVCGARVDGETEDGNTYCYNCRSTYTTLVSGEGKKRQETIWIKRLKNPL